MNKKIFLNFLIFLVLIFGLATGFSNKKTEPKYKSGEFIVKINSKKHARTDSLENLIVTNTRGFTVESIRAFVTDPRFAVVKIAEHHLTMEAISTLNRSDDFEYVQPNFVYSLLDVPNDTEFNKAWGLLNLGQTINNLKGKEGADIGVLPLWEKGIVGKKEIIVAVVDTGIDSKHPDLAEQVFVNAGEITGNGVDDDNNGFIDDVSGWNFYSGTNNPMDGHSHGTHCSGTIGAVGNNKKGVPGVNWHVTIMPLKIFSDGGGYAGDDEVIEAINYAVKMGARVMSNSWGGGSFSQAMFEAIKNANEKNVMFIAAAGNNYNDNDEYPFYPAGYESDNVVSVAATTNSDSLASFSCWGAKTVHVAAPGKDIYSTVPGEKYAFKSGTSMATPHISGIAALLLSEFPNATPLQIRNALIEGSVPTDALKGKVQGNGRVNVANAYEILKGN